MRLHHSRLSADRLADLKVDRLPRTHMYAGASHDVVIRDVRTLTVNDDGILTLRQRSGYLTTRRHQWRKDAWRDVKLTAGGAAVVTTIL